SLLTDGPFHLQFNQAVQLKGIFHGQFTGDRLNEAAHDHGHGLVLRHAAGHQIEELLFADAGNGGLVTHDDVVLADVDVRVRVRAGNGVHQEGVTTDRVGRVLCTFADLDQAAVSRTATAAGHGLGNDGALGVRCDVHHLGAGVLVLALACKCDGQGFTLGVLAYQVNGRVLHGHLGADVAIDPFHGGALFADGTLGDEVVHVVGPVLDGRVADAGALLHDDLHNGGVQRVRGVDRSRATFDVVNVGVLIGDDQGALELAHVLRVDTEVSLERDVDVHALGHVHERSTGPYCRVQGGELVVAHGDDGAEVLLEDLRVFPQGGVRVQEDNALGFEVLADLVVDNFGFVLGRDAGNEPAALSFRDAELFVGVPDVFGQVFPRCRLLLSGTHEVLDVVEVDAREVCAPRRHGLTVEVLQALEAQMEHPFGLVLLR